MKGVIDGHLDAADEQAVRDQVSNSDFAEAHKELRSVYANNLARGTYLRESRTTIDEKDPLPHYDTWVPVRTPHHVGRKLPFEPYMPHFGDTEEERTKVFKLHQTLLRDANYAPDELSDCESEHRTTLEALRLAGEYTVYDMPDAKVDRAATRYAVSRTEKIYGGSNRLFRIVAKALNMKSTDRVQGILDRVQKREALWDAEEKRRKEEKARRHALLSCLKGNKESDPTDESIQFRDYFCRICLTFFCEKHEGMQVNPNTPIPDSQAVQRKEQWESDRMSLKPCSRHCVLSKQAPVQNVHEGNFDWAQEELLLLNDARDFYEDDPCRISSVVGTKNCLQVYHYLKDAPKRKRKIASSSSPVIDYAKRKSKRRKKGGSGVRKSNPQKGEPDEDEGNSSLAKDFEPCSHAGKCRPDVCECMQRGSKCEASCCCNIVRWVGTSPRTRIGDLCSNRHPGCKCVSGNCQDEICPCRKLQRACDPDLCNDCGAAMSIERQKANNYRHCKNVDVSLLPRKKTLIGRSTIHGLGLFAGEDFEKGDVVGLYLGQALHTKIADIVGVIYEAKDHTFFFDATESIVIDGGPFGSKAKFANHVDGEIDDWKCNCFTALVRVRGDPYIALYASRKIEAGEEIAFDYKFTEPCIPSWAKKRESGRKEKSTGSVARDVGKRTSTLKKKGTR